MYAHAYGSLICFSVTCTGVYLLYSFLNLIQEKHIDILSLKNEQIRMRSSSETHGRGFPTMVCVFIHLCQMYIEVILMLHYKINQV